MKAYGGSGCTDRRSLDLGTSGQLHASAALSPWRPLYPLDTKLCGPGAGMDGMEQLTFLTLPGLELRPLSRATSSQSAISSQQCAVLWPAVQVMVMKPTDGFRDAVSHAL
jgi:hypothetical protein